MKTSRAQIIATLGPVSAKREVLKAMAEHQMDIVRLNFSWGSLDERVEQIKIIKDLERELGRKILIMIDLPGPRVQEGQTHTYNHQASASITDRDKGFIKFGIEHGVDYFAISFTAGSRDVQLCREAILYYSGNQKIIAKIERAIAVESIDEIISVADAIMIARGDLGNEILIEKIPFVQDMIIKKCKIAGKPVIIATHMLFSMTENLIPTRAEVTDVANAILQGSDAVMLSEETSQGKHPVKAVEMMEKIVVEAECHMTGSLHINSL